MEKINMLVFLMIGVISNEVGNDSGICLPYPQRNPLFLASIYFLHEGDCSLPYIKGIYEPRMMLHEKPGMLYRRTVLRKAIQYIEDGMERQALSSFFFGEDLPSPWAGNILISEEGEYLYDE
ncbi:unnamed protein product [Orchesella dallaii]|uniref:Uncharacterized protein n=1 Tax=Orchesella dallaii TaxID=48710 RepID=A0ABP1RWM4_9HEXA